MWTRATCALLTARPAFLALLAVTCCMPALSSGFVLDDLWIAHALRSDATFCARLLAAFTFAVPETNRGAQIAGELPWYAVSDLQVQFVRPLSALTHALDFALFGGSAWPMHAVSMLWLVALVLAACAWYRRLFADDRYACGAASALYALAPGHVFAASWIANRNALIAGTFALLALIAHDRTRTQTLRGGSFMTATCLLASLLAGESGFAAVALLAAHTMCLDPAPWPKRVRALAPCLMVTIAWGCIYDRVLHAGVAGSDLYLYPAHQPLTWLSVAPSRLIVLLWSQGGLPIASLTVLVSERALRVLVPTLALCLSAFIPTLRMLVRCDRRARFGVVGAGLALLPSLGTLPHDRLLIIPDVAALGLFVQWALHNHGRFVNFRRWLLSVRAALSIPLALVCSASLGSFVALEAAPFRDAHRDAALANTSLIFVNPPSAYFPAFMPLRRALEGGPVPLRVRSLVPGIYPSELWREDDHTLVVRVERGFLQRRGTFDADGMPKDPALSAVYLLQALETGFRDRAHPLREGQVVSLGDLSVTVREVSPRGEPVEVAFRFALPLHHERLRFLQWRSHRYEPFVIPPIAQKVRLSAIRE